MWMAVIFGTHAWFTICGNIIENTIYLSFTLHNSQQQLQQQQQHSMTFIVTVWSILFSCYFVAIFGFQISVVQMYLCIFYETQLK